MARRFRHLSLALLLAGPLAAPIEGCSAPILSLDDAISDSHGVQLVAYVETEPVLGFRSDVEGAPVTFFCQGSDIGRDKTDDEGRASITWEDPPGDGSTIEARCLLGGEPLHAKARLFRWDPDRTMIALDIDHTIADTEYKELIFEPTDDESDPIKNARKTLESLSGDFHEIYVTGRPRFLLEKTREWLAAHEFPPGPVVTARGIRDAINPDRYKTRVLKNLREDWPGLAIGIGNKKSDADAYCASGMLPLIVLSKPGDHREIARHAVVLEDWKAIRAFFEENREILQDPEQIRSAIDGKLMLRQPLMKWKRES